MPMTTRAGRSTLSCGHQKALFKAIEERGGIQNFCSCKKGKRSSEDNSLKNLLIQLEDFPNENDVAWNSYYLKARSCVDWWWKKHKNNEYDGLYGRYDVKPELSSALLRSPASNKEEEKTVDKYGHNLSFHFLLNL